MVPVLSFASKDQCYSWSNYHLNHLPQRGRDFDTTIKFNASTGEEYFDDWIINCMWLQVALDAKLVCVALHFFSLFSRDQQARVGSLLRTEEFLPGTSLLLSAQRKNYLHEGGFARYLRTSTCSRIGKWSSQTHHDTSHLPKTLWIETLMNTSTSK